MIPRTVNNMGIFEVMSALQKHIRRGDEVAAMECAVEMGHSSKAFFTMLCNRLEIISHEDIGLANVEAVMFTATAIEQARRHYDAEKAGKWRMMIGNAIRMLCRGPKSREADHFQAAIGLAADLHGTSPDLPDYAFDVHTTKGRKMGRGMKHFRESSAKLMPKPDPDAYEDEAYRVWYERESGAKPKKGGRRANRQLF